MGGNVTHSSEIRKVWSASPAPLNAVNLSDPLKMKFFDKKRSVQISRFKRIFEWQDLLITSTR